MSKLSDRERLLKKIRQQRLTIARLRKQTSDASILKRLNELSAVLDQQAERLATSS